MKRTYIYIDGFNLFHRGLKGTPYKWLDLKALCKRILDQDHQIVCIKYFTAIVSGKTDPGKPLRQQIYIRALQTHIPELIVHYGQFMTHPIKAPLVQPTPTQKWAMVVKTEEKGSDVNLAVHLLNDAWLNHYDCAVVLSNDSDLKEAITLVKKEHKKLIGLALPPNCSPSKVLIGVSDFVKQIRTASLAASQLPASIPGTNIHKPKDWK